MLKYRFSIEEYDNDYRAYVTTSYHSFPSWEEAEDYCRENNKERNGSHLLVRDAIVGRTICCNKEIFNSKKNNLSSEEKQIVR